MNNADASVSLKPAANLACVAMAAVVLAMSCAAPVSTHPAPQNAGGAAADVTSGGDSPAASLAGLRLDLPCKGEKFGENTECHWDPALKQASDPKWKLKKEIVRTFGGNPGVTYDVIIRVRGVVEPKNFTGGVVEQEHFQIGGTPLVDNYNFYSINVSDPAQTYTVNRHQQKTGHFLFSLDYTVTIPIRGGATVTMGEYDDNDISIANHKSIVVPEIPPAPSPFDGQFFQIDVIAAHPKP
jgi:hypothetical protein